MRLSTNVQSERQYVRWGFFGGVARVLHFRLSRWAHQWATSFPRVLLILSRYNWPRRRRRIFIKDAETVYREAIAYWFVSWLFPYYNRKVDCIHLEQSGASTIGILSSTRKRRESSKVRVFSIKFSRSGKGINRRRVKYISCMSFIYLNFRKIDSFTAGDTGICDEC